MNMITMYYMKYLEWWDNQLQWLFLYVWYHNYNSTAYEEKFLKDKIVCYVKLLTWVLK